MDDIGMSADYRSGVSNTVVCELCKCHPEVDARFAEVCAYCGRTVCCDHYIDHISGVTCLDCLPVEEE